MEPPVSFSITHPGLANINLVGDLPIPDSVTDDEINLWTNNFGNHNHNLNQALDAISEVETKAYEKSVADFVARYNPTRKELGQQGYDATIRNAEQVASEDAAKARKAEETRLAGQIAQAEKGMAEIATKVNALATLLPTPSAMLTWLSGPTRARLDWDTHMSGTVDEHSLIVHAAQALFTHDRALAGAVAACLRRNPDVAARLISPAAFAERIVGTRHKSLIWLRDEVALRQTKLASKRAAMNGKKLPGFTKIAAGLKQADLDRRRADLNAGED